MDMKAKACYVLQKGAVPKEEVEYTLPDLKKVAIKGAHTAAELLFAPEGGKEGITQLVQRAAQKSQLNLLESVVVSGGSTMFQGFVERLQDELSALF